jgi:hypothetical protein
MSTLCGTSNITEDQLIIKELLGVLNGIYQHDCYKIETGIYQRFVELERVEVALEKYYNKFNKGECVVPFTKRPALTIA